MYNEIKKNIQKKEQTILFLNRRGYSTFVMCRDCGFVAKCKNCNISLTYHAKENRLKCHYCGYEHSNYSTCPICNSKNIRYFGTGTQKIEDEISKMFADECKGGFTRLPSVIRLDIDTVKTKDGAAKILNKFKDENIDILIGTQMVVKGHHFPNVTLVSALAADTLLNIEDYRAEERTYQTLVQVAGRAGRENLKGRVIFQTYNPDSYSIEYAKTGNYLGLYKTEIKLRRALNYPPFCDIITMIISSEVDDNAHDAASKMYNLLKSDLALSSETYPPVPAPINKINNSYRWRIIIKAQFNDNVVKGINSVLDKFEKLKLNDVKVNINVNPGSMN